MPRSEASRNVGFVLQALTQDLVTERRQVMLLRRENRELRAKVAALEERVEQDGKEPLTAASPRPPAVPGRSAAASRRPSAASRRPPEQP